jgi:hypothetical protein
MGLHFAPWWHAVRLYYDRATARPGGLRHDAGSYPYLDLSEKQ